MTDTKKRDTRTVAQRNKAIRDEQLRDFLSKKCTIQHIIDNIEKIEDVEKHSNMESLEFQRITKANDQRIRLLNKLLPDLKAVEVSQDPENPLFEASTNDRYAELGRLFTSLSGRSSEGDRDTSGGSQTH